MVCVYWGGGAVTAFPVSLLEALAQPGKDRLKDDGTNVSMWLQSAFVRRSCLHNAHSLCVGQS